jgi:hypothetical protein
MSLIEKTRAAPSLILRPLIHIFWFVFSYFHFTCYLNSLRTRYTDRLTLYDQITVLYQHVKTSGLYS